MKPLVKTLLIVGIAAFTVAVGIIVIVVLNRILKKANEEKRRKIRQQQRQEIDRMLEDDAADQVREEPTLTQTASYSASTALHQASDDDNPERDSDKDEPASEDLPDKLVAPDHPTGEPVHTPTRTPICTPTRTPIPTPTRSPVIKARTPQLAAPKSIQKTLPSAAPIASDVRTSAQIASTITTPAPKLTRTPTHTPIRTPILKASSPQLAAPKTVAESVSAAPIASEPHLASASEFVSGDSCDFDVVAQQLSLREILTDKQLSDIRQQRPADISELMLLVKLELQAEAECRLSGERENSSDHATLVSPTDPDEIEEEPIEFPSSQAPAGIPDRTENQEDQADDETEDVVEDIDQSEDTVEAYPSQIDDTMRQLFESFAPMIHVSRSMFFHPETAVREARRHDVSDDEDAHPRIQVIEQDDLKTSSLKGEDPPGSSSENPSTEWARLIIEPGESSISIEIAEPARTEDEAISPSGSGQEVKPRDVIVEVQDEDSSLNSGEQLQDLSDDDIEV